MGALQMIAGLGDRAFWFALDTAFVLTIIVFVHEFGHFIVGRWCGVRVEVFSIGFGREIWGFDDRHGTRWRLSAIPLGGYVKFFGDANAASMPAHERNRLMSPEERRVSFFHKAVWQRALVIAAGPIANFILAIAIGTGIFWAYGKQTIEPRIEAVVAGSPAVKAGFRTGDVVSEIDGRPVTSFDDIRQLIATGTSRPYRVTVQRQGAPVTLSATPVWATLPDGLGGTAQVLQLGVLGPHQRGDVTIRAMGPGEALMLSTRDTYQTVAQTFGFLGSMLGDHRQANQLGGVITIARVSEKVADSMGIVGLLGLIGTLSISIGLLNLFPIPLLDGGHLVFLAYEAVRGRPLAEGAQDLLFRFGFALVMMLVLFVTWNDVSRILPG